MPSHNVRVQTIPFPLGNRKGKTFKLDQAKEPCINLYLALCKSFIIQKCILRSFIIMLNTIFSNAKCRYIGPYIYMSLPTFIMYIGPSLEYKLVMETSIQT